MAGGNQRNFLTVAAFRVGSNIYNVMSITIKINLKQEGQNTNICSFLVEGMRVFVKLFCILLNFLNFSK